jgi:hypothetical protein
MASTIKLKEATIIRYSPMERALFKLLKSRPDKSADTKWLTENVYKELNRPLPKSSRVIITGTVRNFIKKVERNKEPFKIVCTPVNGPYSMEVKIKNVSD